MTVELKRVLCPVDFSESANHALDYALELSSLFKAELLLLHVIDVQFLSPYVVSDLPAVTPGIDQIREQAEKDLAAILQSCNERYPHVQVRTLLTQGAPFVRIVETARSEKTDLIVMGTHGRTGLSHLLIGSVAERVVRKAPCPVLTVKKPDHQFVHP